MEIIYDNAITQTQVSQAAISPAKAIQILKEGNERFVNNKTIKRDMKRQVEQTAEGQFPYAVVLSCIDSRVPTELVFDQGIGDIFNIRIAGNFVTNEILGSMEYACKVAGAKAIVVMGHTDCGAIKGAINKVTLGNLTDMLNYLKPAVEATEDVYADRSSTNAAFVNSVAELNVKLSAKDILVKSEVLRRMYENKEIELIGGLYEVKTGRVQFIKYEA